MQPINAYTRAVRDKLATGIATEHAYRPALETLLRSLAPDLTPVNDPQHIACGAPDFIILRGQVPVAYVEAKDVDTDLRHIERTEQLQRYLAALPDLVLTDYLEFRWYVGGELRDVARLGETTDKGLRTTESGAEAVERLLTAFLQYHAPIVGTARDLASRMANLAQLARSGIARVLRSEGEQGQLHGQLHAFRQVLIPDLSEDAFADMYAQTIAYGLFAARCGHLPGQPFTRQTASWDLPKTNPFLREMFTQIAGPGLDSRVAWVVDDLADLLDRADMVNVLEDFSHQTGREDPVVHFYETFLREYDPKLREVRGVYYTPEPVVSYIVRSVDHLLKTDFNRPRGLADPDVFVLDPACGTGTFLYFAIQLIHDTVVEKQGAAAWPSYVQQHLLKRLFGFELLMAPYTIAHMKLAMLLGELGYGFPDDQRLGIYLTNTLEEAAKQSEAMFAHFISEEANAAAEVKRDKKIMVVMGNPPYSNFGRMNCGDWITGLMRDWRPIGARKWNPDDFMKFMRWAQWRIERTGEGILGFITNSIYLSGVTHGRMRQSLHESFDEVHVLDLHGWSRAREVAPTGVHDENVFEIQQGVGIGVFVRNGQAEEHGWVHWGELWGARADKYECLSRERVPTTEIRKLQSGAPDFLFAPFDAERRAEYEGCWELRTAMPLSSPGVKTERDGVTVHFSQADVGPVVEDFRLLPEGEIRSRYVLGPDSRDWKVARAKEDVLAHQSADNIRPTLFRPFDVRWTWYSGQSRGFIGTPGYKSGQHLVRGPNLALLTSRQVKGPFRHALCSRLIPNYNVTDTAGLLGSACVFPLYVYSSHEPTNTTSQQATLAHIDSPDARRANLSPGFVTDIAARIDLSFVPDGSGDIENTFGPEDVFHYIYAVLYSPTYRARYAEFLKRDFPRIPLTSGRDLFRSLCALGRELVALHLLESPALDETPARFEGLGDNTVAKVGYSEAEHRVSINGGQFFSGVAPDVYAFQVGGYQVLNKWLKDRKGRALTFEDMRHYCRVVMALQETIRLMAEIDVVIEARGGWPEAFATPSNPL